MMEYLKFLYHSPKGFYDFFPDLFEAAVRYALADAHNIYFRYIFKHFNNSKKPIQRVCVRCVSCN